MSEVSITQLRISVVSSTFIIFVYFSVSWGGWQLVERSAYFIDFVSLFMDMHVQVFIVLF